MFSTFQNFLAKRNISSSFVDEERTMLEFTINDIHYVFIYNFKEDPVYVRIAIPNAGDVDLNNPKDIRMLYELTTSYKVGKAYAANGQVWFVAETFIYAREDIDSLFLRLLQVLRDMLNQYRLIHNGKNTEESNT